MNAQDAILIALFLPLAGALGIALAGRINDNLRETVTLVTAGGLAYTVWQIVPEIMAGGRPGVTLAEVVPGISIAFTLSLPGVPSLGMMPPTRRGKISPPSAAKVVGVPY